MSVLYRKCQEIENAPPQPTSYDYNDNGIIWSVFARTNFPPYAHAMYTAIRDNDAEEVSRLVAKHGSIETDGVVAINTCIGRGYNALHMACDLKRLRCVEALLKCPSIDLARSDRYGMTPLHLACSNGQLAIADMLLRIPPTPGLIRPNMVVGTVVADWVGKNGERREIKVGRAKVDVNYTGYTGYMGYSPLHFAAGSSLDVTNLLLANDDIDINQSFKGLTPLHLARTDSITQALLQSPDINVNVRDDAGLTPLHFACHRDNLFSVKELLSRQEIDVNAVDDDGVTPLHIACFMSRYKIVQALVGHKNIDVNTNNTDDPDMSFLCLAARSRQNLLELFLKHQSIIVTDEIVRHTLNNSIDPERDLLLCDQKFQSMAAEGLKKVDGPLYEALIDLVISFVGFNSDDQA